MIKNNSEIKRLVAKVKPENEGSNRLFEIEEYAVNYKCYCKGLYSKNHIDVMDIFITLGKIN